MIPVQLAHPFKEGHCRSPVIKGVPTQTTIKCRWPDGTVKHAVFNFLIDALGKFDFVEGVPVTGSNPPVLPVYKMQIMTPIDGQTQSWEAQTLPVKVWLDGPIATVLIFGDPQSPDQFTPRFHVTIWHGHSVDVRFIGANDAAFKVAELWVDVKLYKDGALIYSKGAFPMSRASRWTKLIAGMQPGVKFDFPYLISTGAVPNYDTSITINESAIADTYQRWVNAPKDLTDAGNLTKAMGMGGGRPEIGPYPTYDALWLYTGDKRMREVSLGNADLAAAWHCHFRQADGKYYSIEDNPGSQLLNLVGVTVVGDPDSWGWVADLSHQPSMFYLPYLLTGDPFYLEEMHYWASWSAAYSNGAAVNNHCGRGPTGKEGYIPGIRCITMRGQAWALRNRAEVAWITPDDMPEKAYFDRLTRECIKAFEGERGIGDLTDPMRAWGQRINPQTNPLHFWESGNNLFWQYPLDPAKTGTAISTWEQSFLIYALKRLKDLGYPTEPLIAYMQVLVDSLLALDHRLMATNRLPTGVPLDQIKNQYEPGFDFEANWTAQTTNPEHGYGFVAIPAGNLTAIGNPALKNNPKWAILPR